VAVLSSFILSIFALVGLQLYMGVLRQKCIPTYESFLNNSNIGFNMSYKFYQKSMENESMLRNCLLRYLFFILLQLIGIKTMEIMFFVVMQVEVQNVLMVMFAGKIEASILILDIQGRLSFLFILIYVGIVLIITVGLCLRVFD
jgi:hypothetical protein